MNSSSNTKKCGRRACFLSDIHWNKALYIGLAHK